MALQSFNDNYEDNSTESGFQFTFFCEICREGFRSKFQESSTYKKSSFFRFVGQSVSTVASVIGAGNIGYNLERGSNILSERFQGMSPAWHQEHEGAFQRAQNEAREHFQRCPKCTKWLCENDWNEQEGLCTECAPRVNVEVAHAKAQKMVRDIQEKAEQTAVFHGEIESKQTLCPNCSKPAGEGKFCNHCGTPMSLLKCKRCGATSPAGTRFCGECGNKLS